MRLKRTVTIEFDRVKITTTHNHKTSLWCEFCQAETEFINQTEAVELAKIMQTQGLIINRENLHFYQSSEDCVFVCLNSILNNENNQSME
ncbi:MAG: hypothetical protein M3Q99_13770 [Acidobacteriota bacterium]|nr:hypothetical protein [Acidobacteriota bacterium]